MKLDSRRAFCQTGCAAEPAKTGNTQVNCLAEDGSSPQNTQSETSMAVYGNVVVAAFNDARGKVSAHAEQEMQKLTGGLQLPGGMKLPF